VCDFLVNEMKQGRMPKSFLPIQSGVGNIANAVLDALDQSTDIPPFEMYTEVVQDSVMKLLLSGRCKFASTCSMTFSHEAMMEFFDHIDKLHDKLLMRPSEISNNPEVIRRIGVISMNTAIECDIFGNINSSHIGGTRLMNGIGGSGDFTRNAYTSIFLCPSIKKDDTISTIVPMVTHVDHTVHSVDIIITDQGVADLRAKDPIQAAEEIIEHAAHPVYRPLLREYLKLSKGGHIVQNLDYALSFHRALLKDGDMRKADFSKSAYDIYSTCRATGPHAPWCGMLRLDSIF
jgi:acyl-CoA hydrolase